MILNYALIGTVPEVEQYRDTLPALIAEFEANRLTPEEIAEMRDLMSNPTKLNVFCSKRDQAMLLQTARGVTIELCAQHFYGIDPNHVDSMSDLIDTIRGMDEALETK